MAQALVQGEGRFGWVDIPDGVVVDVEVCGDGRCLSQGGLLEFVSWSVELHELGRAAAEVVGVRSAAAYLGFRGGAATCCPVLAAVCQEEGCAVWGADGCCVVDV